MIHSGKYSKKIENKNCKVYPLNFEDSIKTDKNREDRYNNIEEDRYNNIEEDSYNNIDREKFDQSCKEVINITDNIFNQINKKYFNEAKRLLPDDNYVGFSVTQGNEYRKKRWPIEKFINVAKKVLLLNKKPVFFIEKNNLQLIQRIKEEINNAINNLRLFKKADHGLAMKRQNLAKDAMPSNK